MLHFGLCCLFSKEPIKITTYKKKNLQLLPIEEQKKKIKDVVYSNIENTQKAIDYCFRNNIQTYRVSSDIVPHFDYISTILTKEEINDFWDKLKKIDTKGLILSTHPGQFVNLGSPKESVIKSSLEELVYHKYIVDSLGFYEINIHLGGTYGNKEETKKRFIQTVENNEWLKDYLTIENDELNFSIKDTLEVCNTLNIPCTYDLHHDNCNRLKETNEVEQVYYFEECKKTWLNKGYNFMRMHISSPREGYISASKSRAHSDYIDKNDFPLWLLEKSRDFEICLDIEAKKKEEAIFKLLEDLK